MADDKRRFQLLCLMLATMVAGVAAWLVWSHRRFDQPAEYWVAEAFDEARDWAPDAELLQLEGSLVRPDGVAELQQPGATGWVFLFRSSAHVAEASTPAPKPTVPGAPAPPRKTVNDCFEYRVERGSGRQSNLVRPSGWPRWCAAKRGWPGSGTSPKCSVQEVWRRARQQGAPDPGYAKLSAQLIDGAWRWAFHIQGYVDLSIPDDC